MSGEREQPSGRSPLSGCAILVTALAVVIFLLFFSSWALFRQFDEIVKFTQHTQTKVPLAELASGGNDWAALGKRVEAFSGAVQDGRRAELPLTPEELNLAIAGWDPLRELRGTFHVDGMREGALILSISFPMNGKPRLARDGEPGWIVSDSRYLEGTMIAEPAVSGREVVLRIRDIIVPGATVPREFVEQMSPYRITERYVSDPTIGPVMGKLTKVEIRDGSLVLVSVPGARREGEIDDATVDFSRNRLAMGFGIAACGFLVFAGLVVFTGLRKSSAGKS